MKLYQSLTILFIWLFFTGIFPMLYVAVKTPSVVKGIEILVNNKNIK